MNASLSRAGFQTPASVSLVSIRLVSFPLSRMRAFLSINIRANREIGLKYGSVLPHLRP